MEVPTTAWTRTSVVREHELDADGMLSVVTVCALLQEAASRHADELGLSVDSLSRIGLTWVLSRLRLELGPRPGKDVDLTISTWPSGASGLYATRDFLLAAGNGIPLARATTGWLLLDVARRRPVRLPDDVLSLVPDAPPRSLVDDFQRFAPIGFPASERTVRPGWTDLDVNRHANHVRYVAWMIDAVPPETRSAGRLHRLDLHYRAEVVADRELTIRTAVRGDRDSHVLRQDLVDAENGTVCAESLGVWTIPPSP